MRRCPIAGAHECLRLVYVGGAIGRLPTNIQFATFSLLVVFYARVVYTTDWEEYYKRRVVGVHVTANLVVLLGFCGTVPLVLVDRVLVS